MQRAEMHARHAAKRPVAETVAAPRREIRNTGPVLDLGNTVFFLFRGKPFGIPPLPFGAGQRIMLAYLEARQAGATVSETNAPAYYAALQKLPILFWKYSRPVGKTRRVLRAIGLLRNPFARATEKELVELADFFLLRRMKSGAYFPQETPSTTSRTG